MQATPRFQAGLVDSTYRGFSKDVRQKSEDSQVCPDRTTLEPFL